MNVDIQRAQLFESPTYNEISIESRNQKTIHMGEVQNHLWLQAILILRDSTCTVE